MLSLHRCRPVSDVKPLLTLSRLRHLDLSITRVTSVDGFAESFPLLEELDLRGCRSFRSPRPTLRAHPTDPSRPGLDGYTQPERLHERARAHLPAPRELQAAARPDRHRRGDEPRRARHRGVLRSPVPPGPRTPPPPDEAAPEGLHEPLRPAWCLRPVAPGGTPGLGQRPPGLPRGHRPPARPEGDRHRRLPPAGGFHGPDRTRSPVPAAPERNRPDPGPGPPFTALPPVSAPSLSTGARAWRNSPGWTAAAAWRSCRSAVPTA